MDGAALPAAAQHLRDRVLEALVGIRDTQLDAVQPTSSQAAQGLAPEGLGLGHVQAEHLAAAGGVHAVGDHQGLVPHPPGSRTRSTFASSHKYGYRPSKGRSRKTLTWVSSPRHNLDTWSLPEVVQAHLPRPTGPPCGWTRR
jgi:hypothetical protein